MDASPERGLPDCSGVRITRTRMVAGSVTCLKPLENCHHGGMTLRVRIFLTWATGTADAFLVVFRFLLYSGKGGVIHASI